MANGKTTRPSYELLTPAMALAKTLDENTKVTTLLMGSKGVKTHAQSLIAHGSDEVIVVEDDRLDEYLVLPFASIFAQVIKKINPEIALFCCFYCWARVSP